MGRTARHVSAAVLALGSLAGCSATSSAGAVDPASVADRLEGRLARSAALTFTATYEVRALDGTAQQVVVAQRPPLSSYRAGDHVVVDDGERTYACSTEAPAASCLQVGDHAPGGALAASAGSTSVPDPAGVVGLYRVLGAHPSATAGRRSRRLAGHRSDCLSLRAPAERRPAPRHEACATDDGVFAFSDDGTGGVVRLVDLRRSADEAAFRLPAVPTSPEDLGG